MRVICIGAGPAGLTAATELLRGGAEVVLLETTGHFGGISRTARVGDNRMDMGGHRFFSKDSRVIDWWTELMPLQGAPAMDDKLTGRQIALSPGGPDPKIEDRVFLLRRRVSRIWYRGKFFDYPVRINRRTLRNIGIVSALKAGFGYIAANIRKLPEENLEEFYINRFGRPLYSMFFEGYTEKLWGKHPRDIDASWGAQRVKGLSIAAVLKDIFAKVFLPAAVRKKLQETSLIEEFHYPKFGPGQLWELAAERVQAMGGDIRLHTQAVSFRRDGNRITAVETEHMGKREWIPCDAVVSSMPLSALAKALPGLASGALEIAEQLPYRAFVTLGLLVEKLALPNDTPHKTLGTYPPDCWIYVQDPEVKLGRIQIFNNWSPYMVADPEHTVWMGLEYFCDEGDDFWNLSEEALTQLGVEELVKMGVIISGVKPLLSHKETVEKAYPAYFDSYKHIDKLISNLNQVENLWCIGRNGQHRYNNMDHSMVTGFIAAEKILSGNGDKAALWEVNTEKVYHEEK
ncbi:MAG: NAD(P)/FAD-dependent oxidoreductase [Christensenellales bacterium]|jgi:protoporphyrinogen oxidase